MADSQDERNGKAYSLYTSIRRYFEPLRQHWDKLSAEEQGVVIQEVEAVAAELKAENARLETTIEELDQCGG